MLALSTLDLFLSINEGELLDDFVLTLLASPQLAVFLEKYPLFKQALLKRMPVIRQRLERMLIETRVSPDLATEFYLFQECQLLSPGEFRTALAPTLARLEQISSPFYPEAGSLVQAATFAHARPEESFQPLFLQRWRINLTLRSVTLHHQLLDKEREQLLDELAQQLAASGALAPVMAENETSAGRLWDMTAAQRQQQDYRQLVHYGEFLRQQPELRQLADQLGRSSESHAAAAPQAPQQWIRLRIREPMVQPEEVSGIHQSDDLLRLLPTELATLGIDELEYEFYRRLLEKRLLTYRLQGEGWREREVKQSAQERLRQPQPRGPFIVCVDTSGSMGGFNEQCAKAFCLALMRIALADNRRCYITLFSTGMVSYELSALSGLEQAIRFLSQRFSGGTDLSACISALADRLATPEWRDADAVVISDFIAQRLPDELVARIKQKQRQQLQRFHAVALSSLGKPGILKIFDHIWRFDTSLKSRLSRRWHRRD
ncbi:ATPase RavA stimulator ViaA [Acerihabitans arboris]|uniref:Regulatory protein ViaA n=1 Tax=Acerihabitans arboris TaxID=2691583 RepID=A0A845SRU2_9GAMM|nr:ATPase RavA stimulator ViaA [Acerihabitans arboris]NDL65586.1 ATPase RavA stimulator ViaA [Acerihabitans arboris]